MSRIRSKFFFEFALISLQFEMTDNVGDILLIFATAATNPL